MHKNNEGNERTFQRNYIMKKLYNCIREKKNLALHASDEIGLECH